MQTLNVCLKKCIHVKIILKNLTQRKKLSIHLQVNPSKNELGYYRGKDCMEQFCKDLRENAIKIINYEKKEIISLTDEETEFYKNQKVCHIC